MVENSKPTGSNPNHTICGFNPQNRETEFRTQETEPAQKPNSLGSKTQKLTLAGWVRTRFRKDMNKANNVQAQRQLIHLLIMRYSKTQYCFTIRNKKGPCQEPSPLPLNTYTDFPKSREISPAFPSSAILYGAIKEDNMEINNEDEGSHLAPDVAIKKKNENGRRRAAVLEEIRQKKAAKKLRETSFELDITKPPSTKVVPDSSSGTTAYRPSSEQLFLLSLLSDATDTTKRRKGGESKSSPQTSIFKYISN
ncbi:hypothetical protein LXL04_027289 [Taraxacum kok-saghyz]